MNKDSAADLATRIVQTWPRAIAAHVWEDELLDLDQARASTALVKLRRTLKNAPSISEFLDMYRSLHTDDRSTRPEDCDRCDNQGVTSHLATIDGVDLWQPVTACTCAWGREKAGALAKAVNQNANELDRLFPTRHQPRSQNPQIPAGLF